jgi:hypothetical protein
MAVLLAIGGAVAIAPAAHAATSAQLVLKSVDDPIVRGATDTFTVAMQFDDGTLDTSYTGRVHFSSLTDAAAQLPPDYTFTPADAGDHDFKMNWINPGVQSLTVTDIANPDLTFTASSITVTQAVRIQLTDIQDPIPRGVSDSFAVQAVDYRGVLDPRYSGQVHFTSTDPGATLPVDYSYTREDAGQHTFSLKWLTPGIQTLNVTDNINAGFSDSRSIEVTQATTLKLGGILDPIGRGAINTFSVTAIDNYGQTDPLYAGTIHFMASDPSASIPGNSTLPGGTKSFTVVWATPGEQTLTAKDTVTPSIFATRTGITVTQTADIRLTTITDPIMRGTSTSVTVRAIDTVGATDAGYRGIVHFTSTDPAATLPGDYAFTSSDVGVHTFTLKWVTPGNQKLTVTDTATSAWTDSRAGIWVTQATSLIFSGVQDPIAQAAIDTFTLSAKDQFGTTDPLYTGTVHFTSTDPAATLPADYTFNANDHGAHSTFTVTWETLGVRKLVATDAGNNISGVYDGISVTATANLRLTGIIDPIARGVPNTVPNTSNGLTVTALDASGVTDGGYRGTVHFTSTDPAAVLPADYTFTQTDGGTHTFSPSQLIWTTPGDQKLTVTDAANSLTTSRGGITVTKAKMLRLSNVADPGVQDANDTVTVQAVDQFGNVDPLVNSKIHFSSDDPAATLPPDHKFVPADKGTLNANVIWATPGDHTLTVSVVSGLALTPASKPSITIKALVGLQIEGINQPFPRGTADSFTVRAVDPNNRTATAFHDKIHFSSDDPSALLPADYTFVPADNGVHTFSLAWITPGERTLHVSDLTTPSLSGEVSSITITQATTFRFVGVNDPITHGTSDGFTLQATDVYGQVDPLYRGTVHFTASGGSPVLPANYTFVAADNGQHNFTIMWSVIGDWSLTATDTVHSAITATKQNITVV